MKIHSFFSGIYLLIVAMMFTGCCRSADEVWDDTKTAGRHMSRGVRSMGGKHGDSRQVCCREDFFQCEQDFCYDDFHAMEFDPIPDQQYSKEIAMADVRARTAPQAQNEPGHPMSHIPGIESFKDPQDNPELSGVFQKVYFPYNSNLIKGRENLEAVHKISAYMKAHPDTYLFVEGHCDQRGAEAYNLALGARRSNAVRNMLIQDGVGPENVFTVSYGKERPFDLGNTEEAWAKNRRSEFKIYQQ